MIDQNLLDQWHALYPSEFRLSEKWPFLQDNKITRKWGGTVEWKRRPTDHWEYWGRGYSTPYFRIPGCAKRELDL